MLKYEFGTCSGSQCCCTDGGCRSAEGNCQSNTWYVDPSTGTSMYCTPNACDNPCTIDPTANPKTYVKFLKHNKTVKTVFFKILK